jgi:hypothetical protein
LNAGLKCIELDSTSSAVHILLNSLYHEHFYKFQLAYEHTKTALLLSPDDLNYKMNFVENNFTTGRYSEAVTLTKEILADSATSSLYRPIMRIIATGSLLLDGKINEAENEFSIFLDEFLTCGSLQENTWSFKGSKKYLKRLRFKRSQRKTILAMIRLFETSDTNQLTGEFINSLPKSFRILAVKKKKT